MLKKIFQQEEYGYLGANEYYLYFFSITDGLQYIKSYTWDFQFHRKVNFKAWDFYLYNDSILTLLPDTDYTSVLDIHNLSVIKEFDVKLERLYFPLIIQKQYYFGIILADNVNNYDTVLFNLEKGNIIKNFGEYIGMIDYIGNKCLLFFDTKPSKIYDDSTVCSYLRVLDFYTYEPLWEKDLYDFCFYDELFSNNCFERPPTVITSYKDYLLLHFKKHILCLNIETGETIWHIEDRYKEVEVIENRLYLDKWVGYDVIDAHTGRKLQDFVKFSPIIPGEDFTYTTPTNGESRYYKGYIWRTTRYEREGSETLLVIEPTTGKYVHIEKIPAKSILNPPQFMEDKVILTSRSEAEFFVYQISDFDNLEK